MAGGYRLHVEDCAWGAWSLDLPHVVTSRLRSHRQ